MSKIDDLIKELCPNGVKFEELGNKELFKFYYGKGNKIPEDIGGIYDVYGANGIVSHINEYNCEDVSIIGHIGAVGMVNRCKGKCFVTYNGTIAEVVDKTKVNTQYLYYILTTLNLPSYKKGSQPFLSVSDFDKICIPVPPLEVQCEIVHILDDFTELSAELSAELKARQKQYEYYLENCFIKLSKNCKNTKINDCLTSLTTGLNPRKNFKLNVDGAKLPYITGKDVYNNTINITERTDKISQENVDLINKRAKLQDDIILFASTGTGTVGRMAYIERYTNDWNISETLFVLKTKPEIYTKYLFYVLESEFAKKQYRGKISKGSVPHLKISDLLNVNIPIPEYEEQVRISNLLSKFDMYCHDIFNGLPSEIEARRKQYEYYRDKLLSFKKLKVEE